MNLTKLLVELNEIYESDAGGQWSGHRAAAIVNEVSDAMAKSGHYGLVRAPIPDCNVIDAKRYLSACVAALREQTEEPHALTPPQAAKLLGTTPEAVITLIKSGSLKGSNVGKGNQRPRYRVTQDAIDTYLQAREIERPQKASKSLRNPDVTEFF